MDLISRQAAIDAVKCGALSAAMVYGRTDAGSTALSETVKAIKALPSAQPEQRWIPCSERLPEDYQDVLVWFEYYRYGDYNGIYQMQGIGSYSSEYNSWLINGENGWHKLRVIAWMPLPEPYKERREE